MVRPFRVRWLGTVPFHEALTLQRALFEHRAEDHLLLLEHPHVYTLGASGDLDHVLVDPSAVGATLVRTDRGGDVTYHGPGQLVGYPIVTRPGKRGGGMADTVAYVRSVEQVVIDALADVGLTGAGRVGRYPGVWVDPDGPRPRKIAAIGVKLSRGRTMHGFALNVAPDLGMFGHIVPCGISDLGVTSLVAEGVECDMRAVVDAIAARAADAWAAGLVDRQDVVWRLDPGDLSPFSRGAGAGSAVRPDGHGAEPASNRPAPVPVTLGRAQHGTTARRQRRLAEAGVAAADAVPSTERKPEWLRAKLDLGPEVRALRRTLRELDLVTVCEEAGCPNLSECWSEGTATFMINGERCTRACGFCLVDTRHPDPLAVDEPERVAAAAARLGLRHVVVTAVARDDLPDGGAAAFAATIEAIRSRLPGAGVEVLVPDCRGDDKSLDVIFGSRPDVLNHNLETVARLQRAVRPSAGYARSLAVLARAKAAGLTVKSGVMVGLGETDDEVDAALADLAAVGCDIVTIGQYLRPTTNHLPVARWVPPATFDRFAAVGRELGIGHVEASPLTRSSYHARRAVDAVAR
jgi:lipoic acid synthetase